MASKAAFKKKGSKRLQKLIFVSLDIAGSNHRKLIFYYEIS